MTNDNFINPNPLDRPEILAFIFHPRSSDPSVSQAQGPFEEHLIPVDEDVVIEGRFYVHHASSPTIPYAHGNGEIVSEYDEIANLYTQMGINSFPVGYRGYGKSTGMPTVFHMQSDAHTLFNYVQAHLKANVFSGPLLVMRRSLGSALVSEIVHAYPDEVTGLIIESGFAYTLPLLQRLGINTDALGIQNDTSLNNADKIKAFTKPTLIIHGEHDSLIPFEDAKVLYKASAATQKTLLKIPGADHNSVFHIGMKAYFAAIKELINKVNS